MTVTDHITSLIKIRTVVQQRHIKQAKGRSGLVQHADGDTPTGQPLHKSPCAVDRIDSPHIVCVPRPTTCTFFANESMIRVRRLDMSAQKRFDLAVGARDERVVSLETGDPLETTYVNDGYVLVDYVE